MTGDSLFSSPVKGLLIDISGVLKNADQAIPGSLDAIKMLQESKFPFRLVTNESQITVKELIEKLGKLGFNFKEEDIFSPIPAVIKVVKEENLRPYLLLRPNVLEEFKGINQENPNCVVIGDMDYGFKYDVMNEAFRKLMALENPILLSLGKGKYYKAEDGLTLDVGAFTTALEYSVGIQARIVGKPDSSFFLAAVNDIGIKPEEAMMIGDDIDSDVGGAQKAGIRGVLVRTGKYQNEKHEVKPDGIFDNFGEFIKLLFSNQNNYA